MAARQHQQQQQLSGDGFTSHITGLSKSQLYDIMSQMKVLIDQNQKQARQILIENPRLTRALFQAQIMLGMVQPPQVIPNVQQQGSSQPALSGQKATVHSSQALPAQGGLQGQKSSLQPSIPVNQQLLPQQNIPISIPSSTVTPLNHQSQQMISAPTHLAQQAKGFFSAHPVPPPQSSQIRTIPLAPQTQSPYAMIQSHMPMVSSQAQPSLQSPGMFHQPLQPPLPQQPRPPLQPFSHQLPSQVPHNLNFQPSSAPQQIFSQPLFHSGSFPPSFPHGQPPLPSQPPPQQLYQGGPVMSSDYRNQAGTSMQADRGPWMRGSRENPAASQLPYPPPPPLGQMNNAPVGQPPRLPLLSPEMEKAVLQQVLMLTPEQINLLPPEQRSQVLEIQEILR